MNTHARTHVYTCIHMYTHGRTRVRMCKIEILSTHPLGFGTSNKLCEMHSWWICSLGSPNLQAFCCSDHHWSNGPCPSPCLNNGPILQLCDETSSNLKGAEIGTKTSHSPLLQYASTYYLENLLRSDVIYLLLGKCMHLDSENCQIPWSTERL